MNEKSDFSADELLRYSRHLNLPDFSQSEQLKLKSARVLVVGTGGLGAPVLQYLTAAGVGTIGLIDFDVVDVSNLQRQVLFSTNDVGKSKVEVAKRRLRALNPHLNFVVYNQPLNSENALEILEDFDIIADGTDNFPTRYLINDACVLLGKINVHASVFRYEGQVSVFNYPDQNGERGPNYRDLFANPPAPEFVSSCAEGGIIGVLPGILGSMQALEILKIIIGKGQILSGKIFIFDALSMHSRVLGFKKNAENPISGENPTITELIDYEEFCGHNQQSEQHRAIDVAKLQEWLAGSPVEFQLIDVRETTEYEVGNIGAESMPLSVLESLTEKIATDRPVVIHCKSGARSKKAISLLSKKYGYANLYNLTGGILAWKEKYAPDLIVL
ncbi:MAG: molybdopterin-synthase adenylyltransferase MoeB [Bacteroidota bacterium]